MADVNLMAAMKFTDMKDQVIHWCGRCGCPGKYNNDREFNYSSLYIWDEVHRQANWSSEDFKYCYAFDVIPFVLLDWKIHVLFKHTKLFFSHALTLRYFLQIINGFIGMLFNVCRRNPLTFKKAEGVCLPMPLAPWYNGKKQDKLILLFKTKQLIK